MKRVRKDSMKRGSSLFLRLAGIGMGALVIGIAALILPAMYREWPIEFPSLAYWRYSVILALTLAVAAFFGALHQALQLLNYLDKGKAFSFESVRALKNIKRFSVTIGLIFVVFMPLVYYIGDKDDAPGLILLGMLFAAAPIVVGVFAGVLQRLIQQAVDLKKENDLTV